MFKKTSRLNQSLLKEKMKEIFPNKLDEFNKVKQLYGDKTLCEVKVSQVLGGMRGINAMFYETSKLDANKGILLRNHNLFDLCEKLKYKNSEEPLPESLLWFLFTGELPTEKQTEYMIAEINNRAAVPRETENL